LWNWGKNPENPCILGNKYNRHLVKNLYMGVLAVLVNPGSDVLFCKFFNCENFGSDKRYTFL
jgi:hypothetical protein